MPAISVIVPTRDEWDDAAEVDPVRRLDRDAFEDYEVILQHDAGRGASWGRNRGIERASADKLVFLDDDSHPRSGYLAAADRALDEAAAVAGRVIHPRDDVFSRYFAEDYDHGDQPRYLPPPAIPVGCNMAFRRELFETVGGFDEHIAYGHEERELADRFRRQFDLYYEPAMAVEHSFADSIVDYWRTLYDMEYQRPYYWSTKGISRSRQVLRVVASLLGPHEYVGVTPRHALARAGGNIAANLGRIRALRDGHRRPDGHRPEPPARRES